MKILFLHLSDAHLREGTNLSQINANAIIRSLAQMGEFDECVLIFSGDIVQSGGENEYKVAGRLFSGIIKGINDRYFEKKHHIHVMVVPGNHDNLALNPDRKMEELKSYYTDKKLESHFNDELCQLNHFYTFANRNKCYYKGKIIDVRTIKVGYLNIKFNLINSAPFSLLGSDNGDKGMHYLPDREISKLDWSGKEDYTISVLHHGPEWFSDKTKEALYEKLYVNSDLILVGHEHYSKNEDKIVNGKHKVDISTGIALYGTDTEHGFNAIILDTDAKKLKGYKYIYNGNIYKPSKMPILQNDKIIFKGKNRFRHTEKYEEYLLTDIDQREGDKYMDYFVFPLLESKNINDELKNYSAPTIEKFIELLRTKKIISIEGSARTGKTILAKYLCSYLSKEYSPILLTEDDFGTKDNNKIIRYALENQYGEDVDYDDYEQMDALDKVLIVDRYDKISKNRWNDFFYAKKEEFGHIILFCGIDWNINIKEKAIEELTEDSIFYLKICPFYYTKRKELIEKICSNNKEQKIKDVGEMVTRINDEITNQIKFFQLTPDFIYQYVTYYLNFPYIKTQNDSNVFNKVFEGNITFRISRSTKEENVSEILTALDYVAHKIHFSKLYPLPNNDFEDAVNEYNSDYDNSLKPKLVYEVAIKANILKEITDKFAVAFCDENLLAYFVASHLNRKFNEGRGSDELQYILNNICFGINGDILLFLSYITSNVQILNPIMESLINHMDSWDELDIDNKNVEYLTKPMKPIKTELPDKEKKQKHEEEKNNMEKEIVEERQQESDIESLYSYDEKKVNSFGNKISKSINYLELVVKILPNFRHILTGEQKQNITNILYTYPNKLLYFMLKDIDINCEKIMDEIMRKHPKTKRGLLITKDMLIKSLQNQSIAYILGIYDFIACTAASGKAIKELNEKFDYNKNTNYKIQNIMMEENIGNFVALSEKAEKLYNKTELGIVKQMLISIMRKYFLTHNVVLTGNAQHVVSIFFKESEQKELQMIQAKNRFIKK
nr:metallophosphoesterase [uncultured Faecalibacillus sp.]